VAGVVVLVARVVGDVMMAAVDAADITHTNFSSGNAKGKRNFLLFDIDYLDDEKSFVTSQTSKKIFV
jgi:hypothetical protein